MKKEAYLKLMGLDKRAWGPSEVLAEAAPDHIRNTAKAQNRLAKHYFNKAYNEYPNKQRYKYLIQLGGDAKARATKDQTIYENKLKEQMSTAKAIGQNYRWLTNLLSPHVWFKK